MAICAWCHEDLGRHEGSHGICKPCAKKTLREWEERMSRKTLVGRGGMVDETHGVELWHEGRVIGRDPDMLKNPSVAPEGYELRVPQNWRGVLPEWACWKDGHEGK